MKKRVLIAYAIVQCSVISINTYGVDQEEKIFKNPIHSNIWAVYVQKKQPKKALDLFINLIKKNKYAYKWLVNFLHGTCQFNKIRQMLPIIKTASPQFLKEDPDTAFRVAHALVRSNVVINGALQMLAYNPEAMDILVPVHNKFPTHQKVASLLATLYDLNNEPQNAIEVTEKYLNSSVLKPMDFIMLFKNASRYVKLDDKKKALEIVKKSLELQPKFINGWMLSAAINDQLGNTQEAIDDCLKGLETGGPNAIMHQYLIKLFLKLKKAKHQLSTFSLSKECFAGVLQLLNQKKYKEGLKKLDDCLSQKAQS